MDGHFTRKDFRSAFQSLPKEGLEAAAQALVRAIDAAGDKREEYWKNRIYPFWHDIWPKSRDLISNNLARILSELSIASGDAFPSALVVLKDWLRPIDRADQVIQKLCESPLCGKFPDEALEFMHLITKDQLWFPEEFDRCMVAIINASPNLADDVRFKRLRDFQRRRSI